MNAQCAHDALADARRLIHDAQVIQQRANYDAVADGTEPKEYARAHRIVSENLAEAHAIIARVRSTYEYASER